MKNYFNFGYVVLDKNQVHICQRKRDCNITEHSAVFIICGVMVDAIQVKTGNLNAIQLNSSLKSSFEIHCSKYSISLVYNTRT